METKNRILLYVLAIVAVASVGLVAVYFYNQNKSAGSKNANIAQATPNSGSSIQIDPAVLKKTTPFVYNTYLIPAYYGQQYKSVIEAAVYDLNVQITARVASGLPAGMLMAPCTTEYNSQEISKIAAKNSLAKCIVEGVPKESGEFTVRVYFSVPGGSSEFFRDLPLTVYIQGS